MKIGDRIFVRGYIDEIRKDTVIVRNDGGYFGTIPSEVMGELPSAEPERKKGKWIDAVLPNDSGGLQVQVCDQCNTFFPLAYTGGGHRFCPACGADMRPREEEQE